MANPIVRSRASGLDAAPGVIDLLCDVGRLARWEATFPDDVPLRAQYVIDVPRDMSVRIRCPRRVHYRPLRRPPTIWLQPQAGLRTPTGRQQLHASILLAAVALGLMLAAMLVSVGRWFL